jgi:Curlin associated repeat
MIRKSYLSAVMLSMVAFSSIAAAPAEARNGFRFVVTPKGEDARVVRDGLRLYSIARDLRNRAKVDQRGTGNGAAVSQSGSGNWSGIFQRGSGHSATVTQNGKNNAFGIFQFGRNQNTSAVQQGDGNVGLVFEGGW